MNKFLEEVLNSKQFQNSKGETISIHSETTKYQCIYLQNLVAEGKFSKSIEIGFAYGISTLAITEEVVKNSGVHVVIDKYQKDSDGWNGNGLELIHKAGYDDKVEFYEQFCYEALPKFMLDKRKFDFAYVDSTKQFDWIFVNFFYLDKILEINGIIVFDDVQEPGIRKVARFISKLPNYEIHSQYPINSRLPLSRKTASLLRFLPYSERILRDDIIETDFKLGLNASCIAVKKIAEDNRHWSWHKEF